MSTKALVQTRLAFIDVLRGIAVLLMVQLHTSHGWVHPGARSGAVWQAAQFLGGLAAPMFLTLSGLSLGLRWAADARRGRGPRLVLELSRALQLVVLGYLLRLQMWFIDGAGWANLPALPGQVLLLAAYASLFFVLGRWRGRPEPSARERNPAWRGRAGLAAGPTPHGGRPRTGLARLRSGLAWLRDLRSGWRAPQLMAVLAFGVAAFALGLDQVARHAPERLTGTVRVDILQCIGGSLALVTLVAGALGARFARPGAYVLLAVAAAFFSSWTRSWVPGPLPEPIAAYLGRWPAAPGQSAVGLFPLFPWAAYAFAGTALGLVWGRLHDDALALRVWQLAALGLAWGLLVRESNPAIYEVMQSTPWLTQPLRAANRFAWVLAFAGLCCAWTRWARESAAPLETMGRASLLIYWVHLEFAFGAAGNPLAKELGLRAWAAGSLALIAAMWCVAHVRTRGQTGAPYQPVSASAR